MSFLTYRSQISALNTPMESLSLSLFLAMCLFEKILCISSHVNCRRLVFFLFILLYYFLKYMHMVLIIDVRMLNITNHVLKVEIPSKRLTVIHVE